LAKAQSAEESGKLGAATVYYQMAKRRASGPLAEQIAAHLARLTQERQHAKSRLAARPVD
jgi:hypothetical protein